MKLSQLYISSFVQSEMKNESSLGGGKYWKKFYMKMAPDWTFAVTEQKKLLKIFAIVCGLVTVLKKKLWRLFMDGVQLPQGYRHFEEAVYFLPFSSQKLLVLILLTSDWWKAKSTLEPPSGFEYGTPGLGIQRLNH